MRAPVSYLLPLALACGCAGTVVKTASAPWHEARSRRFAVLTDGDPEEARKLVGDLERFHRIMIARTSVEEREAAPPLRVFLTTRPSGYRALGGRKKTTGEFRATVRGNFAIVSDIEEKGRKVTGSHIRKKRDDGWHPQSARSILFHEYVHYLQSQTRAREPSWYREGVAEYMAATELREDGRYTVGCAPDHRTTVRPYLTWLPMSRVMQADSILDVGGRYHDSYAQAWYAVHYFAQNEVRARQLSSYLRSWAEHRPYEESIQEAFAMTPDAFDAMIEEYSLRKSFDCSLALGSDLSGTRIDVRELPEAEAQLQVATLLMATTGANAAVFDLLEQAAAAAPNNGRVYAARARALLGVAVSQQRRRGTLATEDAPPPVENPRAKALAAIELALKHAPSDPEVLVVEGHVRSSHAALLQSRGDAASRKQASEALQQSRKAYRSAIKADETLAEAYYGLGRTYLIQDNGSREAVVVLEAAGYLLPLATPVAFDLAQLHIARRQPAEAEGLLRNVITSSKSPSMVAAAKQLLTGLQVASARQPAPAPQREPQADSPNSRCDARSERGPFCR